jgi:hypothetical protein
VTTRSPRDFFSFPPMNPNAAGFKKAAPALAGAFLRRLVWVRPGFGFCWQVRQPGASLSGRLSRKRLREAGW